MEQKKRFIQYILDDPNRFLPYPFKEDSHIKDFGEFESAFKKAFPRQKNNITSDELISLFETPECKRKMRSQLSEKDYEDIYGDGHIVIYTTEKNKVIKTEIPKIQSKGYFKNDKQIRGYSRTKAKKFSSVETKFIQTRKEKRLTPKQIISEYNKHFTENPRTDSSIKNKIYRL